MYIFINFGIFSTQNTFKKKNLMFVRYLFLFLFFFLQANAQKEVPKDYFKQPMEIPMVLSGTFGEFRSNHFHAGIDIKTQGREGVEVRASAAGYISRIRVNAYGYGKVIYISHPNGYQTVYAHLKKFAPKIEKFIKDLQYKQESYEIQLFPKPEDFPVEELELIGYSGNTGSSGGPHLHFEVRDEYSRPMNPFLFGLDEAKDTTSPTLRSVFAYTASPNAHVNFKQGRTKLKIVKQSDGNYKVPQIVAAGDIYFGVEAYDRLDYAFNKNGYYEVHSDLNGNDIFRSTFDRFSYDETRFLNRMIDYSYYLEHKRRIQQLKSYRYNKLEINNLDINNGIISIEDSLDFKYTLKVKDFHGNSTTVQIPIKYSREKLIEKDSVVETPYFVKTSNAFAIEKDLVDIYIPKNALYEDMYLDIDIKGDTIRLHDYRVPIHKSITLGFDVSNYKAEDKQQLFIGRQMPWGKIYYMDTKKKENRFTAKTTEFGKFILAKDTEPPTIKPVNFRDKQWLSKFRYLKVEIDDKVTGIDSYRATVNGKFILMEYDYKKKTLTHDFNDGVVTDSENNFKLVVTDKVGNTTIFESKFFRKN
jgi:hypothetical protein